jgi:superfamily II DNA or RNA helicase
MPQFALEPEGSFLGIRPSHGVSSDVVDLLERMHTECCTLVALPEDGRYFLPPRMLVAVLRQLAAEGSFSHRGKPLVMNLFSSLPLQGEMVLIRGDSVPIAACEAIGRGCPPWCIYRGCFRLFAESVEWEDLAPKPVLHPVAIDCLPLLQLVDRHGAFANLLLDYAGKEFAFHDSNGLSRRDLAAEARWEADLLETDFRRHAMGQSRYYCPLDKVGKALTFLLEIGWKVVDSQNRRVVRQGCVEAEVRAAPTHVHVTGRVRYGDHDADLSAVVGAFNRRDRFLQLDDQSVGLLEEVPPLQAFEGAELEPAGLRLRKCQVGLLQPLFGTEGVIVDPQLRVSRQRLVGESFQGHLRGYQQQGVNWLAFLYDLGFNGLLADDMGLGKTVQVLAFLSTLPKENCHLIVAPTSLLFNWRQEIGRFLPHHSITLYQGAERSLEEMRGIFLTSYGTLRRDIGHLESVQFHCLILDEAQAIKNADSETAQAANRLQSAFRLSLSGTPIENRPQELWSHLHFLMPELLGDRQQFNARLLAAKGDRRHLEQIRMQIRPFILRRTKEEVAPELPPKIEQLITIEMTSDQRAAYERLIASGRRVAEEGSRMEVLELILRLRQFCCHPLLLGSEEGSAKFEMVLEDLNTLAEERRKVLVYSQFASMLHLIGRYLSLPYVLLEGETRDREKVVRTFQDDPAIPIFLISLKAGGTGLNLTAADTVLLYDPWWNEAAEQQAIDRAHRMGQTKSVVAKRYIVNDSIEQKLMQLKAHKRSLADDFVDESGLTDEMLRQLLQ